VPVVVTVKAVMLTLAIAALASVLRWRPPASSAGRRASGAAPRIGP
jgi:hypothetical protein